MKITSKMKKHAAFEARSLDIEEEQRDLTMTERIYRWFYINIANEKSPNASLEAVKEATCEEIASLAQEELQEACDILRAL